MKAKIAAADKSGRFICIQGAQYFRLRDAATRRVRKTEGRIEKLGESLAAKPKLSAPFPWSVPKVSG